MLPRQRARSVAHLAAEVDHQRVRTEEQLLAFLRNFTSALVVAPGHPEHGALYLVRGLLNAVQRYSWCVGRVRYADGVIGRLTGSAGASRRVWHAGNPGEVERRAHTLPPFPCCARTRSGACPTTWSGVRPSRAAPIPRQRRTSCAIADARVAAAAAVESNDVLYGGNPEYRQELLAYLHSVVEVRALALHVAGGA